MVGKEGMCPWDRPTIYNATKTGNLEILKWILEHENRGFAATSEQCSDHGGFATIVRAKPERRVGKAHIIV
jgi:hypothetical protein